RGGPPHHIPPGRAGLRDRAGAGGQEVVAQLPAQSPAGVHQTIAAVRTARRPVERPLPAALMDVEEARALARSKCEKDTTYRHLVSVEGVMRRLARHSGEDEEMWALPALFHDLDQDVTAADASRHARPAAERLREARG